ncbi:MAG: metallophosphoesterase [Candidatus Eisenbacteria bacterium]
MANHAFGRFFRFFVLLAAVSLAAPVLAQTVLVPAGSTWKYLDDGSDQGTLWKEPLFDDGGWQEGPAQLGYGDGDEATVVGYGPDPNNKYITTYFRHAFEVADPSAYALLEIRLLRDDGAVAYLNGFEIVRSNMPEGAIDYDTLASSTVGGDAEDEFFVYYAASSVLTAGTNHLAVEIHQRSVTSSDISLDLELIGWEELPSLVRKAPYLIYNGSNSGMQVLWQLIWTETCTIEWGEDESYSMGVAETHECGSAHQHSYTITGLTPGTVYLYRVVAGQDTCAGSFRAAPESDAEAVRFFVYGDTRTYPEDHDSVAAAMVDAYAVDDSLHTMLLCMGDLVSDGDLEEDWDTEFFDRSCEGIQTMLASLPYQACMGNHEGSGALFVKYFPYPFVDGRYWSFDYGPAHFTVVDQYTSYGPGSAELDWIESDLAASTKPWKFLYLHEPGWSAGGGHENNVSVQDYIHPLCVEHGVAMVFGGHNHYYARAEVACIQHITTGGGGAPLRTPDPGYPHIVAAAEAFHYCKVEIRGDRLVFTAVAPDGTVIDSVARGTPIGVAPGGQGATPLVPFLYPSMPNPFNPTATLRFSLPEPAYVSLTVHDPAGRHVRVLAHSTYGDGVSEIVWDGRDSEGRDAGAGVYFARFEAGGFTAARKIVLLR